MGAKDILLREDARQKIARGAALFADTVQVTLGPRGRSVALEQAGAAPLLTKDGAAVAAALSFPDRFENLGAQIVKDAALRTSADAGDGTTTTVVLARAMIREGMKFLAVGVDAMAIRRGMEAATRSACQALDGQARACTGQAMIRQVATVAANGDAETGRLVAQAFDRVGVRGVVAVAEGDGLESSLELRQGFQIDQGWITPAFSTDREDRVLLEDACVFLLGQKLTTLDHVLPMLEAAARERAPLLVIADAVEGAALATLVANARGGEVRACAVRAPGIGDERSAILLDLAALTGATVIQPDSGRDAAAVTAADLGRARRVEVERGKTLLVDGAGGRDSVVARAAALEAELAEMRPGPQADAFTRRLAALSGTGAMIMIGGRTDAECRAARARTDNAVRAARAALEEGVVPGGGVALLRAQQALRGLRVPTEAEQAGVDVVTRALDEPLKRIAANAGAEPLVVAAKVARSPGSFGYDAARGEYCDLQEAGVLDARKVVRLALQNAASVAALMLTTEGMVAEANAASRDMDADHA